MGTIRFVNDYVEHIAEVVDYPNDCSSLKAWEPVYKNELDRCKVTIIDNEAYEIYHEKGTDNYRAVDVSEYPESYNDLLKETKGFKVVKNNKATIVILGNEYLESALNPFLKKVANIRLALGSYTDTSEIKSKIMSNLMDLVKLEYDLDDKVLFLYDDHIIYGEQTRTYRMLSPWGQLP